MDIEKTIYKLKKQMKEINLKDETSKEKKQYDSEKYYKHKDIYKKYYKRNKEKLNNYSIQHRRDIKSLIRKFDNRCVSIIYENFIIEF